MIARLLKFLDWLLWPLGVEIKRARFGRRWDWKFRRWVRQAKERGVDPNDIGDREWDVDPLKIALDKFYLPHVRPDSVVLELGPGSGRLTRHVIGRCKHMILADSSAFAAKWLPRYLAGKGSLEVIRLRLPAFPGVADGGVDLVLANAVFDHVYVDDAYRFLREFHRVLRPGGVAAFNAPDLMTDVGLELFTGHLSDTDARSIFQFYHPEVVARLAAETGFHLRQHESHQRYTYYVLEKAAEPG